MARIDLDDPYTSFLESQVKAGLYNTISEAARAAIRREMEIAEARRVASVLAEIEKGEEDIREGRVHIYSREFLRQLSLEGREKAKKGLPLKPEVLP